MKLRFFKNPVVLFLILLLGYNNPAHPQKKELQEASYFYKIFFGSIENQPAVVEIYKTKEGIQGRFHHPGGSPTVFLKKSEKDSSHNDHWYFREVSNASNAPDSMIYWEGIYSDNRFKGNIKGEKNSIKEFELKESHPEGMTALSYKHVDKKIASKSSENEDSYYRIHHVFPIETGKADNSWINKQIKKLLNFDENASFERNVKDESKEAEEVFTETLADLEDSYGIRWQRETFTTVAYNKKGFLILKKTETNYTGGAHGYTGASYSVLDTESQRIISVSDLLDIDPSTLQKTLEKELRKKYDLSEDQELTSLLLVDEIPLNKHFYFDDKGVYFVYNPYDIAPYSMGIIELFIPFKKLKNNMTPRFRKRIDKPATVSANGKII